jgi:hypothetical protein
MLVVWVQHKYTSDGVFGLVFRRSRRSVRNGGQAVKRSPVSFCKYSIYNFISLVDDTNLINIANQ